MITSDIRKNIKRLRKQLTAEQQQQAAHKVFEKIRRQTFFKQAKHIGFYLDVDGELPTHQLINYSLKLKKQCYLPSIKGEGMIFRRFNKHTALRKNVFNIAEPHSRCQSISASDLDLVIVPLVAFDKNANRIGMGAGYYDKTFEFKRRMRTLSRPLLVGIAHTCQKLQHCITPQAWDVPMDCLVTEDELIIRKKNVRAWSRKKA